MSALRRYLKRLMAFATKRSDEDRLRDEIEHHLALQTADNMRAGLPPDEARRQAVLKLGSIESIKASYRDEEGLPSLDAFLQDVRYSLRQLSRSPVFALTATLSLALGIGVSTAMFTVVYNVLLRPLPYPDPDRLLRLVQAQNSGDLTMPEYELVKQHIRALGSVAAYRGGGERRIGVPEHQNWVSTLVVTTDFLQTLGVRPQIGREFTSAETRAGGPSVVILSDGVWRRVFGADPAIVGRTIILNDDSPTVVGVLPAGFWFPQPAEVLVPLRPTGSLADLGTNTGVIARLDRDAGIAQAQAQLSSMTEQLRVSGGSLPRGYRGLMLISYHGWMVGDVRPNLLLLFGATGLLLLIACGNLALLLLTRFATRVREVAIRAALGSSRRRLLSQFLTENLVVTALGAVAGVAAAHGLVVAFLSLAPFDLPASSAIGMNGVVLAFSVATACGTAMLVTLAPFSSSGRLNVPESLRSEGKNPGAGAVRARTRNLFIVTEVALSTALLVAAGLLIQTLHRTTQQQLGFVPDAVLTFETPFAPERARNSDDRLQFAQALLARLERTPGVLGVAATNLLPLSGWSNLPTQRDGHPDHSIGGMEVRAVTPQFFDVMGIPLRRGRSLSDRDVTAAGPVVLVNDTVAGRWWPDGGALGDRLTIGRFQGKELLKDVSREVIGVVGDTRAMTLQTPPRPTVFVPLTAGFHTASLAWVVKTDGHPRLAENIRAAVFAVDPTQRITRVRMMDEIVASASARPRFNASLFSAFAFVALALTVVGLYGVLSFLVAQRRQEIGTRMALGASRGHVLRVFVRQGLSLTAVGLLLGLLAAMLVSRWLSTLLFGVTPTDPFSFAGVAVLVLAVGCAASYIPARRAASIDPLVAIRGD